MGYGQNVLPAGMPQMPMAPGLLQMQMPPRMPQMPMAPHMPQTPGPPGVPPADPMTQAGLNFGPDGPPAVTALQSLPESSSSYAAKVGSTGAPRVSPVGNMFVNDY